MNLLDSQLRASVVLAGFIVGVVACTSGQRLIAATPPSAPPQTATVSADVPNLYEAQRQVDEYIRSGRYDKDVAKVIVAARAWLEERAKTAVKPAIVLDIDETSLSNWPAYRVNGWGRIVNGGCDLQEGPCGLRAFQALGQSNVSTGIKGNRFHQSERYPSFLEAHRRRRGKKTLQPDSTVFFLHGVARPTQNLVGVKRLLLIR